MLDRKLCIPAQTRELCLSYAFQLGIGPLSLEQFVLHTLGSAVEGNGSIVTISLRNKLSAMH